MIEIIGEPGRTATKEEIEAFLSREEKQPERPAWQEAMLRTFLRRH